MKKYRFIALVALLLTSLFSYLQIKPLILGVNGTANTIYLNMTKIGLYNEQPGIKIPEVKLEFGRELTLPIGEALPKDEITTTTGARFVAWVIQSPTGGLQKIETMPAKVGLILQAHFDGGIGSSTSEPGISEEPLTSEEPSSSDDELLPGLYIKEVGASTPLAQHKLEENGLFPNSTETEYKLLSLEVEVGFKFYFTTTNDLSGSGATTLPSYQSTNKAGEIGYTFSENTEKTNITGDFIKTSGFNEGGGSNNWFKFISPTELGSLEFKVAGTYDLYVVFWDNFGWAQLYIAPSQS